MAGSKKLRPTRKMKPVVLVLCEGETEECYVEFLRQQYRLPIKIVAKVVGQKIDKKLINRHKKELRISNSEPIDCFLIYDADVFSVIEKIQEYDARSILSNPCLEIWFLAHSEKIPEQVFSSSACVGRLKTKDEWKNYKKGMLSPSQKLLLWNQRLEAGNRINAETDKNKNFSTVAEFIDFLESHKTK